MQIQAILSGCCKLSPEPFNSNERYWPLVTLFQGGDLGCQVCPALLGHAGAPGPHPWRGHRAVPARHPADVGRYQALVNCGLYLSAFISCHLLLMEYIFDLIKLSWQAYPVCLVTTLYFR